MKIGMISELSRIWKLYLNISQYNSWKQTNESSTRWWRIPVKNTLAICDDLPVSFNFVVPIHCIFSPVYTPIEKKRAEIDNRYKSERHCVKCLLLGFEFHMDVTRDRGHHHVEIDAIGELVGGESNLVFRPNEIPSSSCLPIQIVSCFSYISSMK